LAIPTPEKRYEVYKYNVNTWEPSESSFVALQPEDYTAMGQLSLTASTALNYIPQYLTQKFPFAQEGDVKTVVYNTGTTQLTYTNGAWVSNPFKINKTEQFVFSSIGWVFDPTIYHTMITEDYQDMVTYVLETDSIAVFAHPYYKNEEYYFGFASRYSNVSFRLSYRDPYFTGDYIQPVTIDPELNSLETPEEKVALMWSRLKLGMNIFLQRRFPDAIPFVNGVAVNYVIKVYIYYPDGVTSGSEYYNYTYTCTAAGTPPTFEFVSVEKAN